MHLDLLVWALIPANIKFLPNNLYIFPVTTLGVSGLPDAQEDTLKRNWSQSDRRWAVEFSNMALYDTRSLYNGYAGAGLPLGFPVLRRAVSPFGSTTAPTGPFSSLLLEVALQNFKREIRQFNF
jgi:hypothetical protein